MSEPDDWEETGAELPVRGDEPAPGRLTAGYYSK